MRSLRARLVALAVVAAVGVGACSSDAEKATPTVPTEVERTTTTTEKQASTTTTTEAPATTEAATTTTVPGPTYPLTGLPMVNPAAATRPAMVVKIDNNPEARPQSGLNEADIVFEENVEGVTRFAAVFQSNGADPVGPIRSGRTQDIILLGSFDHPLFVWSGGNKRVTDAILNSDLQQINQSGPLFRLKGRKSPHNLYGNVSELFTLAAPTAVAPQAQFSYRDADTPAVGDDIAGVKLTMEGSMKARWQWDPASGRFLRFTDERVHSDAIGDTQLSTENVVVLFVDYQASPADRRSPEAQTLGTGDAWVYTDGKFVAGTWTRDDRTEPFTLTTADGDIIELTPGRTFVELARHDQAATVPVGVDPADVGYPRA